MRLLILTQAFDLDDPALGFFYRWIEELAKQLEHVHVVCLKKGTYRLPENTAAPSFGRESGTSRLKYISRFYRYIFSLRQEYDVIFVHMNSEYVVFVGAFWRLWGKRIVFCRNHKVA